MQPLDTTQEHEDMLILVDAEDREIGVMPKAQCHEGEGILHRAFSLFVFNSKGELLLQQRAAQKPLWPGYWSNSCCSHPRQSESIAIAADRRIQEELGFSCSFTSLYSFKYHARYKNIGSERELCHVLAGYSDAPVQANPDEVAHWRYVSVRQLNQELDADKSHFTPWFQMEWQQIRSLYLADILKNCLDYRG